ISRVRHERNRRCNALPVPHPVRAARDGSTRCVGAARAASGAVLMNGDRRTVTRLVRHASSLRSVEPLALREQHALIGGDAKLEARRDAPRSEEHTSELQSRENLVCRLLLEKKNKT